MRTEVLTPRADRKATLTTYIQTKSDKLRPAIVVLPGGAYTHLSWREAEPIARVFLAAGFNAFILRYSLLEDTKFPDGALWEASWAVWYVREHAEEFGIDPHRVFVIGFSAGGHLAGSIGTRWADPAIRITPDMPRGMNRPDGMILSYGVLDGGKYWHNETIGYSVGTLTPTEAQRADATVMNHVDAETCPAFIWHCSDDGAVPPRNSFLMARKLDEFGIPYEFHVVPRGGHGIANGTEEVCMENPNLIVEDAVDWLQMAVDWCLRGGQNDKEGAAV